MDLSNPDSFRKQIAEAQTSIQKLYSFRRTVDERIADLKDLIRANANFLPDAEREAEMVSLEMLKVPETISEAVKIALFIAKARSIRVAPLEIKQIAQERGFDFDPYTNPMASVHTILKRMREAEPPEVDFDEATGTYGSLSDLPIDIADETMFSRLNELAWTRIVNEDKEATDRVAGEVIQHFLAEVKTKPTRKR